MCEDIDAFDTSLRLSDDITDQMIEVVCRVGILHQGLKVVGARCPAVFAERRNLFSDFSLPWIRKGRYDIEDSRLLTMTCLSALLLSFAQKLCIDEQGLGIVLPAEGARRPGWLLPEIGVGVTSLLQDWNPAKYVDSGYHRWVSTVLLVNELRPA